MPFGANQKFNGFVPFKLIAVIKHSDVELITATFEIYNLFMDNQKKFFNID